MWTLVFPVFKSWILRNPFLKDIFIIQRFYAFCNGKNGRDANKNGLFFGWTEKVPKVNDVILIVLWTLASLSEIRYLYVAVCFVTFLVNDLYGFISWQKMKKRQAFGMDISLEKSL